MEIKYNYQDGGFVIILHNNRHIYDAYDIDDRTMYLYSIFSEKYSGNDFTSLPTWIGAVL